MKAKSDVLRFLFVTCLFFLSRDALVAADYKIGTDDVLEVTFWQDARLNKSVRVDADGTITLDLIGRIEAAGLSADELQRDIIRQITRLNTSVSQAVVRVTGFNHNYVFMSGLLRSPGKKSFEVIPDLWTLINEAGGILEGGDLTRVTIIRGGDQAGKVELVNVSAAIASGQVDKLPKVDREDTIDIPRIPGGFSGADLSRSVELKNLIYVVGAVNRPGPIQFQDNVDILDALALAGGDRADADLRKVRVISKDGYFGQSFQYDLERYAATGRPARYVLRKEDTFIVPARKTPFFGLRLDIATITALAGTATTVILLLDRLNNDPNTTATVLQR